MSSEDDKAVIYLPDDDRVAVRAVISPYFTMAASIIEVLRGLSRGSPASWHRHFRESTRALDLSALDVFGAQMPDFLSSPPETARTTITAELERMASTPHDVVEQQLREDFGEAIPPAFEPYLRDPETALDRLVSTLDAYWNATLQPMWRAMEAVLEREVLRIGRELATEGPSALLARISHRIELRGDVLVWDILPDGAPVVNPQPDLAQRQLVLAPMCSGPDAVWSSSSRDESVMIAYAAPGVGLLWQQPGSEPDDGLDRLLGHTRARVMRAVHTPITTADVALELSISPALASHHLKALRNLGLVDGARFGRFVYYRVTTRGRNVWEAIET